MRTAGSAAAAVPANAQAIIKGGNNLHNAIEYLAGQRLHAIVLVPRMQPFSVAVEVCVKTGYAQIKITEIHRKCLMSKNG